MTRLEKLGIPQINSGFKEGEGELEFERRVSDELKGLNKEDIELWKALSKQTAINNKRWMDAQEEFEDYKGEIPEVKEMRITIKADKVIENFKNLLSSLDSQQIFLIRRLNYYANKKRKLEEKSNELIEKI